MGFPSESMEATYRNPMKEVLRFLDQYHKDHFKVYNLCSERGYDAQKFYGRVATFPFDDHNAPAFEQIMQFCLSVQAWLASSPLNIAVVHCKAGKGRTGLMICAWLLYTLEWRSPDESLDFYAAMRTENKKGVTIPSQIRYVKYFHSSLSQPTSSRPLLLQRIIFHTLPKSGHPSDFHFTVQVGKTVVFTFKSYIEVQRLKDAPTVHRVDTKKKRRYRKEKKELGVNPNEKEDDNDEEGDGQQKSIAIFECGGVPVCGDVKVEFDKQGTRVFGFWFNTFFIQDLHLILNKPELDKGHKDKSHKLYDEDFKIEAVFAELGEELPCKLVKDSSLSHIRSQPPSSSFDLEILNS